MNHQCRAFSYYCDERVCLYVCLCVCLSAIICSQLHVLSSPIFFVYVTYCRGSVLLWRHSDTLCTSGFMDDVIFAHKPMLLDIAAQLKRLAIKCAEEYQLQAIGRMGLVFGR